MFNIEYVKDLQWSNPEHTSITCTVKYAEFNEEHPTGLSANDMYEHIQQMWKNAIDGVYGPIKEFDPFEGAEEFKFENMTMPVTHL